MKLYKIAYKSLIAAAMMCAAGTVHAAGDDTEARIENLLSQMTLQEKVGQLNQLSGYGYHQAMVDAVRGGAVGSLLNEVNPEVVNALQREAVENSRLHIPLIFARDVIHGFKTIFPIPVGQSATWNPSLVEEGSRVAAAEASSAGVRWTFSPMVDIARDARWGRLAEGYGEDPYLTTVMGLAAVRGYQGDDLSKPGTMAACVKHFCGYGASEGGRDYNTTWIPEPLLRDVYLPPFKAGAEAGAATFMCSFNDINGVPSSGNAFLLRDVLRGEWGWDGLLVSDWNSIGEMVAHGYAADKRHAAALGANAGVDVDMEAHAYSDNLVSLVENGTVPVSVIDDMVRNVLRLKFRLGLFDNPYVDMATANRFYEPASLDAARRTAEESAVLLTNNGVLPLKNVKKIFVTGPMADAKHDQNGTWCFDMEKDRTVTPLEALREMYGADNVIYMPGLAYSRDRDTSHFDDAVAAAKAADVILYFGGEEAVLSGEAHSRADISLPGAQTAYLRALKAAGRPLVTVVIAGRPITLPEEKELSDAILFMFHPGTMGGPALANVLSGKAVPGGKLPISFPRMVGQVPMYYAHKNTGRPTFEMTLIDDIPLEAGQTSTGCTSYWLDAGLDPLFPFGYGLSYTTFEYGVPELSATEIGTDGSLTVSCTVTNTGSVTATDVAQLYVRDPVASLARPVKELKGFEKLSLAPGESRTVTFTLAADDLAFHNLRGERVVEPGDFHLWVDNSSACTKQPITFKVK
ncbi:MAG: beta-glucosidase BglX [Bacteroidales bacterium]|nr:beta-glucosidase BglX [Bacteroidales bacterium]